MKCDRCHINRCETRACTCSCHVPPIVTLCQKSAEYGKICAKDEGHLGPCHFIRCEVCKTIQVGLTLYNERQTCRDCVQKLSSELQDLKKAEEAVNHPAHYGGADDPFEHVKVALAKGWDKDAFIYTCTKYLWRCGKKRDNSELQDLKKARWYLDRRIQELETK